ncbi:MAG: endolytic transglycosylase MltG, partial [Bacteroidota bacterium]
MKKLFFSVVSFSLIAACVFAYLLLAAPNINKKRVAVKIPTGSSYEDVLRILRGNNVLKNEYTFSLVSDMKHYPDRIKSGHYILTGGMNNRQIVNMLR